MDDQDTNESNANRKIRQLDVSVINRIAAGEIIIQPANALKELLENSIDANSTMIDILVKDGGLKLLQISDNGDGIDKVDMSLLCERFATSKLSKFEDLESIATYGFRGEALASISHIARLSVVSKIPLSPLAYKSFYLNGRLTDANFKTDGRNAEPKPIAGRTGTQIIVEDLFYNVPSRIKALRSKNDEFSKILDVIGRYAIHTNGVGFSCKKFGESYQVLATRPGIPLTDRIRTVFGSLIANDLLNFEVDGQRKEEYEDESYINKYGLIRVSGALTNSNYNNKKKIQPVFFINNRLVACDPLKRAINSIYQFFLPRGTLPFVYLSLEIEPQNVDVNVHPTKREVRFLNEEEIIEIISGKIHTLLTSIDSSREFKAQNTLSLRGDLKRPNNEYQPLSGEILHNQHSSQPPKKYRQENKLVRVDAQQSKLNTFLSSQSQNHYNGQMAKELTESSLELDENMGDKQGIENASFSVVNSENKLNSKLDDQYQSTNKKRVEVNLESILSLRRELTDAVNKPLTNIFTNSSYIGIVDESRRLCCFQFDVKLFMCDYSSVLYEFFYQVALSEFCNYGEFVLSELMPIERLLEPFYSLETLHDLKSKTEVIQLIMTMKDMFQEYFQIKLSYDSEEMPVLISLPMLLKNVSPYLTKLPYFIYRLGAHIEFEDERECLKGILKEISLLYVPEAISNDSSNPIPNENNPENDYIKQRNAAKRNDLDHNLENVLFPVIKQRFIATDCIIDNVVQVADLPGLYKVFERC